MTYDLMTFFLLTVISITLLCVPMEGLEPPHLAASDPKSDVSTNFTTWALRAAKVMDLMEMITHSIPNL
jgi:hypothetical protein